MPRCWSHCFCQRFTSNQLNRSLQRAVHHDTPILKSLTILQCPELFRTLFRLLVFNYFILCGWKLMTCPWTVYWTHLDANKTWYKVWSLEPSNWTTQIFPWVPKSLVSVKENSQGKGWVPHIFLSLLARAKEMPKPKRRDSLEGAESKCFWGVKCSWYLSGLMRNHEKPINIESKDNTSHPSSTASNMLSNSGKGTIDMPLMPSCGEAVTNPGTSILQLLFHARQSHEIEKRRWPHQRFFSKVVVSNLHTHSSSPGFFYLINKIKQTHTNTWMYTHALFQLKVS